MAGAGMKLLTPGKYDGEAYFERFAKLLNAYMGCQDNDYCDMLEVAARLIAPITISDIIGDGNYLGPTRKSRRRVQTTQCPVVLCAHIPHGQGRIHYRGQRGRLERNGGMAPTIRALCPD